MIMLCDILNRAGVDTLGVLDVQIRVPVLAGVPQAQGDLFVGPVTESIRPTTTPIPQEGVVVVRAETFAGNTHSLHTLDGPTCFYDVCEPVLDDLILGVLTVPDGAAAYLVHTEEHGANAFGPGIYEICGQRERADAIRRVAD